MAPSSRTSSPFGNSRPAIAPRGQRGAGPGDQEIALRPDDAGGGAFLLFFVVFHILHFTTGTIDPSEYQKGAVYDNLDRAFQHPLFVAIYVAAAVTIGFHLRHAVWSFFQTGGWDKPNRNPTFRRLSTGTAVVVAVGFMAIPLAFWTGAIG